MPVPLLWDEAVGRLRSRISPQYYDMWLRPIELLSFDGATLRLRAPNSYIRSWFESNFLGSLLKEIQDLGHDAVRVEFDAGGQAEPAAVRRQRRQPLATAHHGDQAAQHRDDDRAPHPRIEQRAAA
jgi:chromosomal replication initiation ATPase DnaA